MARGFALAASILAGLAVTAGAFGAHGLETRLSEEMLAIWEVAARYQMYHALAMFVAAWLVARRRRGGKVAGWSFGLGIGLFSGSLYLLAVTGIRWLGAITPIGGTLFLVGWVALAVGFASHPAPALSDARSQSVAAAGDRR